MADVTETLPHGTSVRREGGRVVAVTSVDGHTLATLTWDDGSLARATLRLPHGRDVVLAGKGGTHPVLGEVDRLCDDAGQTLAYFGRIDWAEPTVIPPLDRPGALPAGAGAAVLNLLAICARAADRAALRYRGPYATAALFDALLASFVVEGELAEVLERFTATVERDAVLGRMNTPEVDFVPAPFEWSWPHARVCVQRREGVERIYVDGRSFDALRRGPRRVLEREDGGAVAAIVIGTEIWAEVVVLQPDGTLRDGPQSLPEAPADLVGEPLPLEVTRVLAEAVAQRAVAPLANVVREVLETVPLVWGDPGLAIARKTDGRIELHAGLVPALPTEPTALLGVLLEIIEPLALGLAQSRLADAHDALLRR